MQPIIVWYRNDLRIHDHPALQTASQDGSAVLSVFIFDDVQLKGRHRGSNRNRFLVESLQDLRASLENLGSTLVIRHGKPAEVLRDLAAETGAQAIYYSADYTPYALRRDKAVKNELESDSIAFRGFPGRLAVGNLDAIKAGNGNVYKVFTPFYKNWQQIERRQVAEVPAKLQALHVADAGTIPKIEDLTDADELSDVVQHGGETSGRKQLLSFLNDHISEYKDMHNNMAGGGTSRLSPYLHFGCLSVREIEMMLPAHDPTGGVAAWHRQLAWREFYHYVLYHFPDNATKEFQERFRSLSWSYDQDALQAWQEGRTGYPIVDAGMRQLMQEGWMHNRARLIVGSFLTKDLGIDWRLGEEHFMRMLVDGDQANNNGNWQWITSVGVDPAPVFRRLYNPASQQATHDPTGQYVRTYVPELRKVPDKYLAEPWKMPEAVQQEAGCIIGHDYPAPIVDHKEARKLTLDQFRAASAGATAGQA